MPNITIESLRTQLSELQAEVMARDSLIGELRDSIIGLMDAYQDILSEDEPNHRSYVFRQVRYERARDALSRIHNPSAVLDLKRQLTAMQLYVKGLKDDIVRANNALHGNYYIRALAFLEKASNSTPPDLSAVEELVKDAERYRFSKSKAYVAVNPHAKTCLWILRGIFELPSGGFDEAVDAAMLAAHKKEGTKT